MSLRDVELILGSPFLSMEDREDETYWYIQEQEKGPHLPSGGPWGPGGINVTYRKGKVIEKKYNDLWINKYELKAFEEMNSSNSAQQTEQMPRP